MAKRNPLSAFMLLKREELPLALMMFGYFFSVITTFWILKPLKKAKFVGYYKEAGGLDLMGWHLDGAQAELLAKVLNMAVAFAAVVVFTWLARNLRRQQLTFVFCTFFFLAFVGFFIAGGEPSEAKGWLFYLYGDLYNSLMVATFFAFLNDSFTPTGAKRTYGPIILGGVLGGAFGSLFLRARVDAFSYRTWMLICIGITLLIAVLAAFAGREVAKDPPEEHEEDEHEEDREDEAEVKRQANAAVEGARLVTRSPYLLAIVTIVALYELVSTILDFQFTKTTLALVSQEDLDNHFSTVYAITNGAAAFIQLFLTSWILGRFRHTVALLIMPLAVLSVSAGYLAFPLLWMGAALSMSDNSLNYSINQSAREALYTPTPRDHKYKAKAFIDMFVQRAAKAAAVFLGLGITVALGSDLDSMRYLSILTIAIIGVWLFAATYAGRRFEERLARGEIPASPDAEAEPQAPTPS